MLEIIKVIILGIIEGITEWLTISSTGHMILVEQFLKLNVSEDYWNMFLVVIQLGPRCRFSVFRKALAFSEGRPEGEGDIPVSEQREVHHVAQDPGVLHSRDHYRTAVR